MSIETVAQNAQSSFADPQNGQQPIDADQVTANDNALRTKHNLHDADATIHVQGSLYANRPAAGTLGQKWMTTDAGAIRLFRDNGSAWEEIAYVPTTGDSTITGVLTFSTAPVFTNNQAFAAGVTIATTLGVTGASTLHGVSATDINASGTLGVSGATTLASTLGVTGAVTMNSTLGVTGAVTAASFSGSGSGLTSIPAGNLTGSLPAISGASLTNLNASALASGTVPTGVLPTSYSSLSITSVSGATATYTTVKGAGGGAPQLNLDNTATYFAVFDTDPNTTFIDTTAPTGSSAYLRVSVGGTSYRILMKQD